jgi:hypothetical protein
MAKFRGIFPEVIIKNIHDYDFEKMCYIYYVYAKEKLLDTPQLKQNLFILKDYILLWYASIPRQKLAITSNFYKILEHVDINEFYIRGMY